MAKDGTNSQKKYIIEWTGENTGYLYKLAVIPSYNDSNYASLTDTDEPYQCLNDYEFTPFEYDKYPIGLGAAPKLKLDIDLTLCSADFAKVLCDPFVTFNRVTTFNTDSIFPCHETFTTGNIFELYIDFGFGGGFQQIYVGTQITSIEEYDNQKNILSIETESIFKTITSQVRFDNFLFLHCFYTQNGSSEAVKNTSLEAAPFYFQRVFQEYNNTTIGVVCDYAGDYYGYFDNFSEFIEGIENNCKVLLKKIYRKTTYDTFNIESPAVTYYKQNNKLNGARGLSLSESDLKIVAYVGFIDLPTTTDFDEIGANDGLLNGLGEEYESLWDFLNDWYGSYLQKGMAGYLTSPVNNLNIIGGGVASISPHTPDTRELFDTKITFFSDVSSKFTISAPESHEVENDSVEVNIFGSRSSEAIEFVQPLHTVPICGNYAFVSNNFIEGASFDVYSGDERSSMRSDKALNCLLFYRTQLRDSDNNAITTGTNNNYYYLCVHHKPQITVSYDNDTDTELYSDAYNDAENGTKKQIMYAGYGVNKAAGEQSGDEWYVPEQFPISEVYGSYYVSAKTMSYFFSNPNQTKIEFSTFLNNGVVEFIGDTGLSPVIMPFFYWNIDLTDFEPQTGVFSNLPTKYEMIKCTVKKDEMAELTLLSRTE